MKFTHIRPIITLLCFGVMFSTLSFASSDIAPYLSEKETGKRDKLAKRCTKIQDKVKAKRERLAKRGKEVEPRKLFFWSLGCFLGGLSILLLTYLIFGALSVSSSWFWVSMLFFALGVFALWAAGALFIWFVLAKAFEKKDR
ncbi:MAG: hypothetical protein AB8F95_16490 [Bacteroidia bacterium]